MNKRDLLRWAVSTAGVCAAPVLATPGKAYRLTVAAVHPTTTPWVKLIAEQFVPEVRERVASLGPGWSVEWSEFYGGQLYKMNASLTSVADGIADIGWVLAASEASRLPLAQFSAAMPFACTDLRVVLDTINELNATIPDLAAEWERNRLVFLGANATDSYHLFTKQPASGYADLRGRRISAPGALALWLQGSNAVAVDGALSTYYTDIQTGVSDGALTIASGALPLRIHEVAPHVSLVDLGCFFGGGLAMNKKRFDAMPKEVQHILREAGQRYSVEVGKLVAQRYEDSLQALQAPRSGGAPVTVRRWSDAERVQWARNLPRLATDWVGLQRSPAAARNIARAYMNGLRRRGAKPLRDWDREL
jgi:TRAP-type transport system periplasmic protein